MPPTLVKFFSAVRVTRIFGSWSQNDLIDLKCSSCEMIERSRSIVIMTDQPSSPNVPPSEMGV